MSVCGWAGMLNKKNQNSNLNFVQPDTGVDIPKTYKAN